MKFRIKTTKGWQIFYIQKSDNGVDWEPVHHHNPCFFSIESAKTAIDDFVNGAGESKYHYVDYNP
jgi:hypothetical protein